jgi:type IV pilus assembly protein PilA
MKDMLLKKILLQRLITLKLRDRRSTKTQNINDQGFTLIELLVVIIIIGLLAAIALPSFLNQAQKARFAEAKSYVGTMSRLQQVYYLEKQTFTGDINKLGLGVNTTSSSFTYSVAMGAVTGAATPQQLDRIITNVAQPNSMAIKAFVSVVGVPSAANVVKVDTIFCIADAIGTATAPGKMIGGLTLSCPTDFSAEQ